MAQATMPFPILARAARLASLALLVAARTAGAQSSENFQELWDTTGLVFEGHPRIDLAREGTVEIWVRHTWKPDEFKFTDVDGTMKAAKEFFGYSVVLAVGGDDDLAFALLINNEGDGVATGSRIGVVNSLKDVGSDMDRFTEGVRNVFYNDVLAGGTRTRIEKFKLASNETFHVALVKEPGTDRLRIYVNGLEQTGRITGSFGDTRDKVVRLGGDIGHNSWTKAGRAGDSKGTVYSQARPFRGALGGLRFYDAALAPASIMALYRLGPTANPTWLHRIEEYGDLVACGDFRTARLDPSVGREVAQPPVLVCTDRLSGNWRPDLQETEAPSLSGSLPGRFGDPPLYTFLPKHGSRAPLQGRSYQVFEDSFWIGDLKHSDGASERDSTWILQPADDKQPQIRFQHRRDRKRSERPAWVLECDSLPVFRRRVDDREIAGTFAGKKEGQRVTLIQPTLDLILEDVSPGSTDLVSVNLQEVTNDMGDLFVFNNNVRYHHSLYGGYDVARMDGFNLLDTGVESSRLIFRTAEKTQYLKDRNNQAVIPFNLRYQGRHQGSAEKSSYVSADSNEWAALNESRVGATMDYSTSESESTSTTEEMSWSISPTIAPFGVGGSGGVTRGTSTGTSHDTGSGTSQTLGNQGISILERVAMQRTNSQVITSKATYQDFNLLHRKELMELHPDFVAAVWRLHADLAVAGKHAAERELIARITGFFGDWGTHYAFGMVYGAIGYWEAAISSDEFENTTKDTASLFERRGQADTGSNAMVNAITKQSLETSRWRARNLGGSGTVSAGGDPVISADSKSVPIFADLRPISELLSPQHFPDAPEIYIDLRSVLAAHLETYAAGVAEAKLEELRAQVIKKGKVTIDDEGSPFFGQTITAEDLNALSTPLVPREDRLSVEFVKLERPGVSVTLSSKLSGRIEASLASAPDERKPILDFKGTVDLWPAGGPPSAPPPVHRTITPTITTDASNVACDAGDTEIDTDDWSDISVSYTTQIVGGGTGIDLDLTWTARELEGNQSYKKGNTVLRSTKKQRIWDMGSDRFKVKSIVSGGSGAATFNVKGKCQGARTYADVGGIVAPVITIDASGHEDHTVQAFSGAARIELELQMDAPRPEPPDAVPSRLMAATNRAPATWNLDAGNGFPGLKLRLDGLRNEWSGIGAVCADVEIPASRFRYPGLVETTHELTFRSGPPPTERFRLIVLGNGLVSLWSHQGNLVTALADGTLKADRDWSDRFELIEHGNDLVSLRSALGTYVSYRDKTWRADQTTIGPAERIKRSPITRWGPGQGGVHLIGDEGRGEGIRHGMARGGLGAPGDASAWTVQVHPDKSVTLKDTTLGIRHLIARANGKVEVGGASSPRGELFKRIDHADGSVSLQGSFGTYVVADNDWVVRANRPSAAEQEKFTLVPHDDGRVSFKTTSGSLIRTQADGSVLHGGGPLYPDWRTGGADWAPGTDTYRLTVRTRWLPSIRTAMANATETGIGSVRAPSRDPVPLTPRFVTRASVPQERAQPLERVEGIAIVAGGDQLDACLGDRDGNGVVDVRDLAAVMLDWGTNGSTNLGDADGSGLVDAGDMVIINATFGQKCRRRGGP